MYAGFSYTDRRNKDNNVANHVYYDLDITNNDTTNKALIPQLNFDEVRSNAFLSNPSDYYVSIVRFNVDTTSLPTVSVQPLVDGVNTNPNKLIYSVTMKYGTYEYQQYFNWVQQDLLTTPPTGIITANDYKNPYYYGYSHQKFVWEVFNRALSSCRAGLSALVVAGGDVFPSANVPFFEIDPITADMALNVDVNYTEFQAVPPALGQIKIFLNQPAFQILSGFPAVFQGIKQLNGKDFQLTCYDLNGQNKITVTPPAPAVAYTAYQQYQEFSNAPLWCPVRNLVFTTSLLPVNPSLSGDPVVFGEGSIKFNNGNNNNLTPVLTDFQIDLVNGKEYKPQVSYTPTAEYRLFDLIGNNALGSISLQVFWRDRFQNLIPFLLAPLNTASIKLLFRHKSFGGQVPNREGH